MLCWMRTTIRVDDRLYARVKERAARTRRTVGAVVEDATRESLARREEARSAGPPRLTTVGGRGPRPGVDLDRAASLLDLPG